MQQPFHTSVPIPIYPFQIDYAHQLMSIGSCFAEHIGGRLQALQLQHILNPFGIVYHPLVLAGLLDKLLDNEAPQTADLFQQQELWRHYDFHSRYAHPDKEITLGIVQQQFQQASEALPQLNYLFLTMGTAYGYQLRDNGQWVNNCHKQPASVFTKKRATVDEIVEKLGNALQRLKKTAPALQVVLTVSPVRHLRDGLVENQRSKAILLLAAEALTEMLPFVHYFPAYEIVLDELRDYRFYARDMLHPDELAVDYIWERFQKSFFSAETQALTARVTDINRALQHRPQHPESVAAQQFNKQLRAKINALEGEHGFLRFEWEEP
jgi:hypothetical protein